MFLFHVFMFRLIKPNWVYRRSPTLPTKRYNFFFYFIITFNPTTSSGLDWSDICATSFVTIGEWYRASLTMQFIVTLEVVTLQVDRILIVSLQIDSLEIFGKYPIIFTPNPFSCFLGWVYRSPEIQTLEPWASYKKSVLHHMSIKFGNFWVDMAVFDD